MSDERGTDWIGNGPAFAHDLPRCDVCGQENRPRDLSKGADGKVRCEGCHGDYLAAEDPALRVLIEAEDPDENEPHAPCTRCGQIKVVCCDEGYRAAPGGGTIHDEPYCRDCCSKERHPAPEIP